MVLVGIGLSLSRFLCWNRLVSCTAWQTSSCQILSPASAQQHQQFSLFSLLASAASPACNSDCTLFYFILFFYTQSCQTSGFISVSMPCNMQVKVPAVSSVYHGWEKQPPYGAFRSFRGETKTSVQATCMCKHGRQLWTHVFGKDHQAKNICSSKDSWTVLYICVLFNPRWPSEHR